MTRSVAARRCFGKVAVSRTASTPSTNLRRLLLVRPLSSSNSTNQAFDRRVKALHRDNAARAHTKWMQHSNTSGTEVTTYDYLRQELAERLVDRLDDIRKDEGFPLALDLGAGAGYIHRAICAEESLGGGPGGIGGVRKLVQLDSVSAMLHRDAHEPVPGGERCDSYRLHVASEEDKLPFPDGTFDLVLSSASLHWVNNLPGVLSEVRRVLKPDGCFLWAMIGGTTLSELRVAMLLAELEREGGVSPHVGPFVELSDIGSLLQRAGFTLPTIDTDTINVAFPNAAVLMEHLQRMGESNASLRRRERTARDTFLAAACIYEELYGGQFDGSSETEVEAHVNVIYAIGWTPHESQQKPLERGTATHRMTDIASE